MMVRIDDRQAGLEHGLVMLGQPVRPDRQKPRSDSFLWRCHSFLPRPDDAIIPAEAASHDDQTVRKFRALFYAPFYATKATGAFAAAGVEVK